MLPFRSSTPFVGSFKLMQSRARCTHALLHFQHKRATSKLSTTDPPTTTATTAARELCPDLVTEERADTEHRLVGTEITTQISPLTGVTEHVVAPAHLVLAVQLHTYDAYELALCFKSRHLIDDWQLALLEPAPWALPVAPLIWGKQVTWTSTAAVVSMTIAGEG